MSSIAHKKIKFNFKSSEVLLTDLPEHCLLLIFDCCDINTLATMTTVCTTLRDFIGTHIFRKLTTVRLAAANAKDIAYNLITVSRFVRVIKPTNFHVKIYRNLQALKDMPLTSLDLNVTTTEASVESHFLGALRYLDNICKRIEAIHIHCSIYDGIHNDPINMDTFASWSNLKKLAISGHDKKTQHFFVFPRGVWNLDILCFRNMYITAGFINDAIHSGSNLKSVTFENCKFEKLTAANIIAMADEVRNRGGHFPLGLIFVNVDLNGSGLLEVGQYFSKFVKG